MVVVGHTELKRFVAVTVVAVGQTEAELTDKVMVSVDTGVDDAVHVNNPETDSVMVIVVAETDAG